MWNNSSIVIQENERRTRLKFYKAMDVQVLLYGSKTLVRVKKHLSRIQASETRFLLCVKVAQEETDSTVQTYAKS